MNLHLGVWYIIPTQADLSFIMTSVTELPCLVVEWFKRKLSVFVRGIYRGISIFHLMKNLHGWVNSNSLLLNTTKDYSHKWDGQTLARGAQYTFHARRNSRWCWKGIQTQNSSLSLLVITGHPRLWCGRFRRMERDEIKQCSNAANMTTFCHTEKYYCSLLRRESMITYLSSYSHLGHIVTEFN